MYRAIVQKLVANQYAIIGSTYDPNFDQNN